MNLFDHPEDHNDHRRNDKYMEVDDSEPFPIRVDVRVACPSSWDVLTSTKKTGSRTYASCRTPAAARSNGESPIFARMREF